MTRAYRRRRTFQLGLPLLARELSEQAAKGRHYVLRTIFAATLFLLGYSYLTALLSPGQIFGIFASLGQGRLLFDRVITLESLGVLIFLPGMTAGAIAGEKERNTLSVLLTTRLAPTTIVFEKLLSRLLPFYALLLLSLPLLALAYALGGLSLDYMIGEIVGLAATSLVIAALSLMCSAWCGSTVSAFFMTYVLGIALYVGGLGYFLLPFHLETFFGFPQLRTRPSAVAIALIPAAIFWLITVRCLVGRAFVAPRNFILSFFQRLDGFFNRINVVTGNIVLTPQRATLPSERPVAWRETAKKSLGTLRYLVRIFVAIELPTVIVLMLAAQGGGAMLGASGLTSWLWIIVWVITAALVAVMCGSLISGETARQTLPVLLATPIPGDQIVRQLFAGAHRLIYVLWVPFVTILGFDNWFHVGRRYMSSQTTHEWLFCSFAQLLVYPYLIAWGTFYLGTKLRSPLWAIVGSLLAVTAVVVAPILFFWVVLERWLHVNPNNPSVWYLMLVSPATIIGLNETGRASFQLTLVNFALYGGILCALRWYCLRNADRLLGRARMERPRVSVETPRPAREEMAAV